jgi:mannose-1-phosphate guanylyltransferase
MTRKRLTITLRDEVLSLIDAAVDGEKIRNRSHAIEYLLSQMFAPKTVKVLILAGGKGVDASPFNGIPKAMIPLHGQPVLAHTLQRLRDAGLTDVVISVGRYGQRIQEYFGDGSQYGMRVSYIQQASDVHGTAQPLLQAQRLFRDTTFLVLYGDVLSDINFLDFLAFHASQKYGLMTMALTSVEHVSMWGVAQLVGSRVAAFEEKPVNPTTHSHLVNAGMYVMEPNIFKVIPPTARRLERDVFPRLAAEGLLVGYSFEGQWYDIATPQMYEAMIRTYKT